MKNILTFLVVSFVALASSAASVAYSVSLYLHVPRVYNNSSSLGERRYQTQKIIGTMMLDTDCSSEPTAIFHLTNATHKVSGSRVTYNTDVQDMRWHAVGSNLKNEFKKSSVCISLDALPSYVPTFTPTDDETLVIVLSGAGTQNLIYGSVAGTLGCGCSWYGHTSPTRIMWTDVVVDTAAVWGTFRMKRKKK